jgi:hypothetical protein
VHNLGKITCNVHQIGVNRGRGHADMCLMWYLLVLWLHMIDTKHDC